MQLPNYKEAKLRNKNQVEREEYTFDSKLANLGKGKTYYVKTYGCQMNEHDSENIKAMLEELCFNEASDYEEADLVLLNTCSIRENAHNKAFGMLGRLKHLKEEKKDLIIGLCGCMAQEEGVVDEILHKYKFVNFVFGTHNLHRLPILLSENLNNHQQEIEVYSKEGNLIEGMPVKRANAYKAYVNIIYGCDKFCTYCIVPFTRGGQRSRNKDDILKEVNKLVQDGYQEVTLLGQNVNAYGKDFDYDYRMEDLLEDVAKTNIHRVRFMTSHPWDFTDKMIEVIAKYPNIMPSIHLPVQSGSSRILKLMGRRYTKESYLELFHKIKDTIPNVSVSTDIIVGFPGETEEEFLNSYRFCEKMQFSKIHVFPYSIRKNTPASKFPNQIPGNIKKERARKLIELSKKMEEDYMKEFLNTEVEVLMEHSKDHISYGHTSNYLAIKVLGDYHSEDIIKVKISSLEYPNCLGEELIKER